MVETGYHYPDNVENHNDRTPHWTNPDYIENAESTGVDEGETNTSDFPHATISLNPSAYSDGLRSTDYGFEIPLNAQINGIVAKSVRSGAKIRDKLVQLIVYNPATRSTLSLSNKAKSRSRTDGYFLVDTYGSVTDLWGASEVTPEQLNNSAAGLFFNVQNIHTAVAPAWQHVLALNVDYTEPEHELTTTLPAVVLQGSLISFDIKIECTNDIDQGQPIDVVVVWPGGMDIISATDDTGEIEVDEGGVIWTTILGADLVSTLSIVAQCTGTGEHTLGVYSEFADTLNSNIDMLTTDPGDVSQVTHTITDPITLANLVNGRNYTLSTYAKVHDATLGGVYEGIKNNRIAVVNGDEVLGGRPSELDAFERVSVGFTYDDSEDLIIKLYGQYEAVSTGSTDRHAGFTIKEGNDSSYSELGNLLEDPELLLSETTNSVLTLPSGGESEYNLTFNAPTITTAPLFQGLTLSIDCDDVTGLEVEATITSENGNISDTKSVVFQENDSVITLGDSTDLWGLINSDIKDQDLVLNLVLKNSTLSEITPEFGNLTLTWELIIDQTGGAPGFTVNGEHSSVYQLFMYDSDVPEGPNYEMDDINIPYHDGSVINTSRIKPKEISVQFRLWGATMTEVREKLSAIKTWLTNNRSNLFIPETKELIFDHSPDEVYNVLLDGSIKVNNKPGTLECEAKFIVPSGVALSTTPTITGSSGNNQGVVAVRPVIVIIADGSPSIVITDSVSGDTLTIDNAFTSGDVVTVDCASRTVTDQDEATYQDDVTLDSVWFQFIDNYDFSSTGGLIQSVSYYEGY